MAAPRRAGDAATRPLRHSSWWSERQFECTSGYTSRPPAAAVHCAEGVAKRSASRNSARPLPGDGGADWPVSLGKLHCMKARIQSIARQQLGMTAHLRDTPAIDDVDEVGSLDRR